MFYLMQLNVGFSHVSIVYINNNINQNVEGIINLTFFKFKYAIIFYLLSLVFDNLTFRVKHQHCDIIMQEIVHQSVQIYSKSMVLTFFKIRNNFKILIMSLIFSLLNYLS